MKLWCTLFQFWISNPGEFSDFFQKMHILFENSLGFVLWLFMSFVGTYFSSVQFSRSVVSDYFRPHESQQARPSLSITNSWSLLKLMSIEWWCHPAILSSVVPFSSCPQSLPASGSFPMSQLFAEYWSCSFSTSPSSKHPRLISFRMDWLYPLVVQGTLKSLLQHHSLKASTFQHSAFFTVRLSHPYMTTGKAIALISCIFVGTVMSLLFNMLPRLVITFLPSSKRV